LYASTARRELRHTPSDRWTASSCLAARPDEAQPGCMPRPRRLVLFRVIRLFAKQLL